MAERTLDDTAFAALCREHEFMRIPRILPCSASREIGVGLTVDGNNLVFNDGTSEYYHRKYGVSNGSVERITSDFRNLGAMIIRH